MSRTRRCWANFFGSASERGWAARNACGSRSELVTRDRRLFWASTNFFAVMMRLPKCQERKIDGAAHARNSHPHHLRPGASTSSPRPASPTARHASIISTRQFTGQPSLPLRTPLSVPQATPPLPGAASHTYYYPLHYFNISTPQPST